MKENLDLWAALTGAIAAGLKGLKSRVKTRSLIIGVIVGAILSFSTMGLLDVFIPAALDKRNIILISFAVGWVANELTDVLDSIVKDAYDIIAEYFRIKFNKK
jgi:multisubunit Na+/H+ antiporter MnhE subunit